MYIRSVNNATRIGSLRVRGRYLLIFLCLFLLIRPAYFGTIDQLDYLFSYGKALVSGIAVCLYIASQLKDKAKDTPFFLLLSLLAVVVVSAIANQQEITDTADWVSMIGIVAIIGISLRSDPYSFLKPVRLLLELYLYINLVTIIMFPDGLYLTLLREGGYYSEGYDAGYYGACWFLGYKNPIARIAIPALCISVLCDYKSKGTITIRTWALFLVAFSQAAMVLTTNGIVFIALMLLLTVLQFGLNRLKSLTLHHYLSIAVVFFIVIVVVGAQFGIIENILHLFGKDATFVGRTYIWREALENFTTFPFLGIGTSYLTLTAAGAWSGWIAHPHNYILYILLKGGLLAFIIVAAVLIIASNNLKLHQYTKVAFILSAGIGVLLLIGMTESLTETVLLYPLVYMGCHVSQYVDLPASLKNESTCGSKRVKYESRV